MELTCNDDIQFMAVACVFSLTQTAELRPQISESGAADLALEALLHSQKVERESQLAQLAVVAQMARESRFCGRLADPQTIDLLMRLVQGGGEDENVRAINEEAPSKLGRNSSSNGEGNGGDTGGSSIATPAGNLNDGHNGGSRRDSVDGAGTRVGVSHEGQASSRGNNAKLQTNSKGRPSLNVRVASPHEGNVRFCVVSIAESLGWNMQHNAKMQSRHAHMSCMPVRESVRGWPAAKNRVVYLQTAKNRKEAAGVRLGAR